MFSSVCAHSGNTSSSSASEVELWPPHPHYIALVLHTQLNSRAETQDRRRHNGQDVRGGGCMEIRCFTSLSSSRPDASPFEDQSFPRIRGFLPPSRQIPPILAQTQLLREGIKKTCFFWGDLSQMWVGGVDDSQTRSKPLKTPQITPKIAFLTRILPFVQGWQ